MPKRENKTTKQEEQKAVAKIAEKIPDRAPRIPVEEYTNLSRIVSNLFRILLYEFISNFHECFTNLFIHEFFANGNEFVSNSLLFNS